MAGCARARTGRGRAVATLTLPSVTSTSTEAGVEPDIERRADRAHGHAAGLDEERPGGVLRHLEVRLAALESHVALAGREVLGDNRPAIQLDDRAVGQRALLDERQRADRPGGSP
jgi:hypothetical protein